MTFVHKKFPMSRLYSDLSSTHSDDNFTENLPVDFFQVQQPRQEVNTEPRHQVPKLISGLVHPQQRRSKQFSEAVTFLGTPPLTLSRLERAQRTFQKLQKRSGFVQQAEIWLAISHRLRGEDVVTLFEGLRTKYPQSRLVFLNLVASYLQPAGAKKTVELSIIRELETYVDRRPQDSFARLLQALLRVKVHKDVAGAIELLEQLYLTDADYTPSLSALSALLRMNNQPRAAIGFAREAARKMPWNYQALALANFNAGTVPGIYKHYEPLGHLRMLADEGDRTALLFGAYFLQDPCCHALSELSD